jgi:hypothetical protein
MFVAIDRTSKFAFVELDEKATTAVSGGFLRNLLKAVPYKILLLYMAVLSLRTLGLALHRSRPPLLCGLDIRLFEILADEEQGILGAFCQGI